MRGHLIVVEGCDRSGKTTQCERLVQSLQEHGKDAELVKFPDRTTQTGKMIDSYLKQTSHLDDHAIHLLFSANRWEAMDALKEKLSQGKTLIVDRYAFSGVAFSAAKGLDFEWCRGPDVGLLVPDVVMFLDLTMDEAEKRGGFGEERYEKRELQMQVRKEFDKLMDDTWKMVDASQTKDQVHTAMLTIVNELPAPGPVRSGLWKETQ
ncbi:thymidylate kinase [Hesseltinella vesiculosa]|uniref:Thymidylate kinase n=1 Tax=Hesseltinella vesiculosa TaxID=101127 RepID=A0A1X2GBC3_9FUNG|nr:thymidylate kinase [Hesseltinella vesiculosa]